MGTLRNLVLILTFAPLLATNSFATNLVQGGSIKGKVVADIPDQRRPLPGVVVRLNSGRSGERELQSVSDQEGQFVFVGLVAGEYVLSIELKGFKKYEQKISVQIEATVEHNALLQPLTLTETVTVTGDQMDTSRT